MSTWLSVNCLWGVVVFALHCCSSRHPSHLLCFSVLCCLCRVVYDVNRETLTPVTAMPFSLVCRPSLRTGVCNFSLTVVYLLCISVVLLKGEFELPLLSRINSCVPNCCVASRYITAYTRILGVYSYLSDSTEARKSRRDIRARKFFFLFHK